MSPTPLMQLIGHGASADVIRLGGGIVLKLFHAGVERGIIHREIESAQRASDEGVAVPRPLGPGDAEGPRAAPRAPSAAGPWMVAKALFSRKSPALHCSRAVSTLPARATRFAS